MAKDDNDLTSQQFAQIVRESPDTYRTTFEVTGTAMVVLDEDTTILLANQEMTRLSGYTREEVEGRMSIKDFVHPKYYDKILAYHNMRRSGEGNPPAQYSFQFLDRTGNEKEILVNVRVIPNTSKSVASLIDITENRIWEEKLQQSEEKFRSLFENAQEGIYQSTIDGRILLANPAFVKLLGYDSLEEVMNLNMRKDVYQDETSRDWVISEFGNLDTYENVELSWKKKDGTPIIVRANGRAKKDDQGEIIFYEAMIVDITENKRVEKELQDSQQLFKDIINCLPDPTFAIDKDSKVIAWNRAMEELTNIKSEQILGLGNYEYSLPIHGKRKPILVDYALSGTLPQGDQYSYARREGESLVVEAFAPAMRDGKGAFLWGSATQLRDSQGNIIGAINTIKDFTEYKEAQKQLEYLTMHDTLTGLYNRIYFDEEMNRLNNKRFAPVTVIICDVDGLKLINDTMGHIKGDELLKAAASVIRTAFRSSDVVARIGGDEFAVILPQTNENIAMAACQRIRDSIEAYNSHGPELRLSLSIGYACGGVPIQEIFIEADNKMNREKLRQSALTKKHFFATLTAILAERDFFNQGHAERLQVMAEIMAAKAKLSDKEKYDLLLLAKFHDIGKVAIPEKILYKNGKLDKAENDEMKRHCEVGFRIAQSSPDLSHIAKHILHHHEWWNGEGYPLKLKGEDIPYHSRIFAILDSFDAMISDRPQRKAYTHERALKEIEADSGIRFQPKLVKLFIEAYWENDCMRG